MWKSVARIPLGERLTRIKSGYAGDEAYNCSAIRSMLHAPMGMYLGAYKPEMENLMKIMQCSMEDLQEMPYGLVALEAARLWKDPENPQTPEAYEVIRILLLPLEKCYAERRKLLE